MYRIAVIGAQDSIFGFGTLGLETFPVTTAEEGEKQLKQLTLGDKYGVIYITEALAAQLAPVIEKYREQMLPAIIQIPGVSGNTKDGIEGIKRSVEQAVGSDILFSNQ
jgi:V/A-type H+-transporting ATPase subunit F